MALNFPTKAEEDQSRHRNNADTGEYNEKLYCCLGGVSTISRLSRLLYIYLNLNLVCFSKEVVYSAYMNSAYRRHPCSNIPYR